VLALKLFLVPSLIAVITLAGRRWGPAIAGWLSGFPVVAGPAQLLVAIDHGPSFAASAAGGALYAALGNASFCIGYAWTAVRYPWWISLAGGLASYAIAALLLHALALSLYPTLAVTLVGLWIASHAFPRNIDASPAVSAPRGELAARMLAAGALVLAVTFFASNLGPRLSGFFSAFPVMACVLASFSHAVSGAGFTIRLLRGMVAGFYALSIFCFSLALALPIWGTAYGFLIALTCAMFVQATSLWLKSSTLVQRNASLTNTE
jgi:hypothetical protein